MSYPTLKSLPIKLLLLSIALISMGCHNDNDAPITDETENETQEPDLIQQKLEEMSIEERVAQMFIVHPEELCTQNPCTKVDEVMIERLQKCPVGGILLFGPNIKNPEQLLKFTTEFKAACKYPPFIAIDEEGGTVARIGRNDNFNVERFPGMYEIGKTEDTSKAFYVGSTIGSYLKEYGINLDFAPEADIFSNAANKVIGKRAFGSTPQVVSPMTGACCDGFHSQGIMTTLKHFPGHGDTETDSHSALPIVTKTWDKLLQCEIIPFKENFDKTDMIMVAHIAVKDVNEMINSRIAPATLSYNMMTGKLRNELGYKGVIITDAMKMTAVTDFFSKPGEAAVQAIKAGTDIVLCPANMLDKDGTYETVLNAVLNGEISEERINESVHRILTLKSQWED